MRPFHSFNKFGTRQNGQKRFSGIRILQYLIVGLLLFYASVTPSKTTSAQDECQDANEIMNFDYRSYGIGVHRSCGSCEFYDVPCLAELAICEALRAKQIALGAPVQAWILASREAARSAGVSPIPPQIRMQLSHLYSADLLDKVRFKTGSGFLGTLQWFRDEMGNKGAITLVDTIVFTSEDRANNPKLWAHELEHVRQYGQLGIDGFAQAYVDQTCILPGDTFAGGYDSGSCKLERQADRKSEYFDKPGFIFCCANRNAPLSLMLRDRVLNGQETFVARDSITIGPNVVLGSQGNVTLRAGRNIVFSPQFRNDLGGKLSASVDPSLGQVCTKYFVIGARFERARRASCPRS